MKLFNILISITFFLFMACANETLKPSDSSEESGTEDSVTNQDQSSQVSDTQTGDSQAGDSDSSAETTESSEAVSGDSQASEGVSSETTESADTQSVGDSTTEESSPASSAESVSSPSTYIGDKIEAESGVVSAGDVDLAGTGATGTYIRLFATGDVMKYTGVDFGDGSNKITFNVAQMNMTDLDFSGAAVELRLGSASGDLIGTFEPAFTTDWDTFEEQATAITVTSGVHDLYLVAQHDLGAGDYDYFKLSYVKEYTGSNTMVDPEGDYVEAAKPAGDVLTISRSDYANRLHGFWLGECIANWTGLVTEMDKTAAPFYTSANWGGADHPSPWGAGLPSNLSSTIDFVIQDPWGSDDDTDIEYIYQYLMYQHKTTQLSGDQIRDGWIKHIYGNDEVSENYLWVSNEQALINMKNGLVPPATGSIANNENYEMIDAQLTTEIFGFFSPGRPDHAMKIANLPIQTTARNNAEWISEFYVLMYSLASYVDSTMTMKEKTQWMADKARQRLPEDSYSAKMYDFVKGKYNEGVTWEDARDALNQKYQIDQDDGYTWSTSGYAYNGGFAAGINFAASIVSLLYGEGDLVETIKIGALCGWDSDNPTATWGGLLGFMIGKDGVEAAFSQFDLSEDFNIHRTRRNFPNSGLNTFTEMAKTGVFIIDRAVQEEMGGVVDLENDVWYIPDNGTTIPYGD